MIEQKSVLVEVFGEAPLVRIIDFLMDNYLYDYSKKQIAEGAGVSRPILFKHWKKLEKYSVVKPTRKFGKTILYKLNDNNSFVKELRRIEFSLIKESSKKIEQESLEKVVA